MNAKNTQTQVDVESFVSSLTKASTAFRDIADCLDAMANSFNVPVADKAKTPDPDEDVAPAKKKSAPVKSKSKETSDEEELTEEYLNGLSYNELKKLAKSRGILAVGARDEITQKILNGDTDADTADDEEEEEESAPAKSSKSKTTAKKSPIKMKPDPEDEEDDESDDDEEEDDPIVTQVNEAVEGMTDEEIADFLTESGIRARGKRQALIALVIKAVREGKIELEDDGEESDDSSDTDIEDDTEKDQDFSDNDLDNPNLTKKRRKALEDFIKQAKSDFKSGELTADDLVEWLSDNNFGKKALLKKKSDKELLDLYIEKACYFIDDDGDFTEDGGYTVNDQPYCCGRPLTYNEDTKTYVCEECGGEYEL